MDQQRLGQVDLNLLFTLYEVGRLGTVTAAAQSLGRTQPAISTRLKQLEQQLGVSLFERASRHGGGVGPTLRWTPVGRAVLEEVGAVVAQLGTVLDQTRSLNTEPVGTLRIGALPTLCAYMLAPVVVKMMNKHPRVRVRMTPGLTSSQIEALRSGELDVLVSVGLVRDPSLRVRALGEIDACLVMRASSTRGDRGSGSDSDSESSNRSRKRSRGSRKSGSSSGTSITLRDVASHDCISYGKIGDPFFDAVWDFLERTNLTRKVRIEVPNIQAIKQLVLEGGGIAILPRYTIVEPTLAIHELRGLDVRLPLCTITRPRGDQSPIIRELFRELSARLS